MIKLEEIFKFKKNLNKKNKKYKKKKNNFIKKRKLMNKK